MRVLAFDTATTATAVALRDDEATAAVLIEARDDPAQDERPRHTQRVIELILDVMRRGDTAWDQLDRIAVGTGPGTFTGLRIGIATAYGLARARNLPLVGVSTLQSLAAAAHAVDPSGPTVATLDAKRGEVFVAAWAAGHDPALHAPAVEPSVHDPQQLAALLEPLGPSPLAVGDGAVKFRPILEQAGVRVPDDGSALHLVTAREHCRLAVHLHAGPPDDVRPTYLRLADAEIARREAGRE